MLLEHKIELSLVCVNWFLTVFCNVAPMATALRIWDYFMLEGSCVRVPPYVSAAPTLGCESLTQLFLGSL